MMHYTLSRLLDDGDEHTSATFTERDPVNAAHLIAAYFNVVNRPMLDGAALAVVFSDGRVQYDGKTEQINRAEPSKYAHMNRGVLESAYDELQAVKYALYDAGFETIPADHGVEEMHRVIRARNAQIAEVERMRANQNAAARDELIEFARGAYEKLNKVDPDHGRENLQNRYRGMLDVLANLLVAIGEADPDERHAAARRLVEEAPCDER